MEITQQQLEDSKVYVSLKSETLQFKHPMDYFQPFLNKFNGLDIETTFIVDNYTINAERENEGDILEGERNTAYGTVLAKIKLPQEFTIDPSLDSLFNEMTGEIGLVYDLSTIKPEMRLYKGKRVTYCMNGCIFGTDNITPISMTSNSYKNIYDITSQYIEKSLTERKNYIDFAQQMHELYLDKDGVYKTMGELMFFAKKNKLLGINPVSDIASYLIDPKSKYSVDKNSGTTMWNIYNAGTEALKKSTIMTESTKTSLLQNVLYKPTILQLN